MYVIWGSKLNTSKILVAIKDDRLMRYLVMLGLMVLLSSTAWTGQRDVVEVTPPAVRSTGKTSLPGTVSVPDNVSLITIQSTLSGYGGVNATEFGAEYSLDGGNTWQLLTFGKTPPSNTRPGARSSIQSGVRMPMPAGTGRLLRTWLDVSGSAITANLEVVYE